jgi:hypothetical protein
VTAREQFGKICAARSRVVRDNSKILGSLIDQRVDQFDWNPRGAEAANEYDRSVPNPGNGDRGSSDTFVDHPIDIS